MFGFLFFFWIFLCEKFMVTFLLLPTLNKMRNTGFVTKHGLIHQVSNQNCILGNFVRVDSMIDYFPYISILS